MVRVGIVEDQMQDFEILKKHVLKYGKEHHLSMEIHHFANGLNFLDEYTPDFGVIFMDVEMPHLDGIETSRKLREIDDSVALVFVTNMIQYAINGYEVNAIDFMVKPVSYYNFSKKMEKAMVYAQRNQKKNIMLHKDGGDVIVPIQSIQYMEKDKNYVLFHTKDGIFRMKTTITDLYQQLKEHEFAKCCSSCIVNLTCIKEVKSDTVVIGGEILPIARRQKKELLLKLAQYLGGQVHE